MSVVTYERRGHLALITLNRPDRLNALDHDMVAELAVAWRRYACDDDAWIAILTGAGRVFCAGRDLRDRQARGETGYGLPRSPERDPFWHDELEKPTIAAVNGHALGGGFFLAARTDLRVAVDIATFEVTEVLRATLAGFQLELSQNLPAAIAAELAAGEPLTAARAYDVGFVNRLVPDGQALPAAIDLAESILSRPPQAVDYNLRLARRLRSRRVPQDVWDQAKAWQAELLDTEDRAESFRAFLERRRPVFRRR
ncbi:MAG TPA: enoyl-CoA hydratase-related protein [Dehalococcoidia bacterium]|nr:enoyl-CoA hydratase-related protein [Dehalococcoidia bacterium]